MDRTSCKLIVGIYFLLTAAGCDNYEFPPSEYPAVETLAVTNVSGSGATLKGKVTRLGSTPITSHGFRYGTQEGLTRFNAEIVELGESYVTGNFESHIQSGLNANTTYFVKSYVSTGSYFVYGEVTSFKTP